MNNKSRQLEHKGEKWQIEIIALSMLIRTRQYSVLIIQCEYTEIEPIIEPIISAWFIKNTGHSNDPDQDALETF